MPLRLRPDIATTDTHDGLVLLDERTGRYWQLNPTGAHVLRVLVEGRDSDHIAQDLATRCHIDPQQAQRDVTAITSLMSNPVTLEHQHRLPPHRRVLPRCLQRSIAATLYCRAHGTWPTWCTGVRTNPFGAHAWIQVGDQPSGEPHPAGHYRPILAIPPAHRRL